MINLYFIMCQKSRATLVNMEKNYLHRILKWSQNIYKNCTPKKKPTQDLAVFFPVSFKSYDRLCNQSSLLARLSVHPSKLPWVNFIKVFFCSIEGTHLQIVIINSVEAWRWFLHLPWSNLLFGYFSFSRLKNRQYSLGLMEGNDIFLLLSSDNSTQSITCSVTDPDTSLTLTNLKIKISIIWVHLFYIWT